MSSRVKIGTWHEVGREITHCPSYYAADTETLRTHDGDYPAFIMFYTGYTVPMPYWLLVTIPSTRVSGRLYSGFGGVNYSSTPLKAGEDVDYHIQANAYLIPDMVKAGRLTLDPAFAYLDADHRSQIDNGPQTWEEVSYLEARQQAAEQDAVLNYGGCE